MPRHEARLPISRWNKSDVLIAMGVLLTFAVMMRTASERPERHLPAQLDRLPPASWPSLDDAAIVDLPVTGFVERGAIRLVVDQAFRSPVLKLIDLRSGGSRFVDHIPDHVGADFVEFYGIETGQRTGYVVSGDRVSDIISMNVVRGRIVEATPAPTLPRPSRRIEFRVGDRPLQEGGTALCSFGDIELIRPVESGTLELHPPFDRPTRLILSHDESHDGIRIGLRHDFTTDATTASISQLPGNSSICISKDSDVRALARFELTAMPGTDALEGGEFTPTKNLLACLPESEFSTPPQIHTWTTGVPGKASAPITGLSAGPYRVGVGLQRRGRYMIWRPVEIAAHALESFAVESLESTMPGFGDEGLTFLPRWVQSFEVTPETSTGSRERRIHRFGPAEVWAVGEGLSRQIGWRDGRGQFLANSTADPAMRDLVNVSTHGPFKKAGAWDAGRVSSALGFDVSCLEIDRLGLRSLPDGEYRVLTLEPDSGDASLDELSDFVEVVGQDDRTTVWGLLPPSTDSPVGRHGRPKVILINRSRPRSVHLTLPNGELRLALAPGEMRELDLTAPTSLFVLSVLRMKDQPEPAAEESVGARLLGDDVMVIEYE